MPIFQNFKSTNIKNAFILNSISSTLIIFIAMSVKSKFDIYTDSNNNHIYVKTNYKSILLTLLATFLSTLTSYLVMYILFGCGGGMLINNS